MRSSGISRNSRVTFSVFYSIEVLTLIERYILLKTQLESVQWFQGYEQLRGSQNNRNSFLFLAISHNQCCRPPTDPARLQHNLRLSLKNFMFLFSKMSFPLLIVYVVHCQHFNTFQIPEQCYLLFNTDTSVIVLGLFEIFKVLFDPLLIVPLVLNLNFTSSWK